MLTGGDGMEKENQKSNYTGCLIVFFIILVIIFIIIVIKYNVKKCDTFLE